jgi:peptidoglycan L-alanyl-D-glutamate endopeptidase CwlK
VINSRDTKLLKPYVQYLCNRLIEECKKQGIEILITSTVRDQEYQSSLYTQGRTKPGSIVTNAKYIGAHGFGLAFDIVPVVNGKTIWNNAGLWNKIGQIGMSIGLEWGGAWRTIVDKPHFQYVQGLTDTQLRSGMLPKFPPIPTAPQPINNQEMFIMNYNLVPIAKGMLINTTTLTCCSKPSNNFQTPSVLKKGINEPINIFAMVFNENRYWYLVNPKTEQWVAAGYVQIIK